ncbi:DUF397 domain-containing protein [Streptomonospora sp. S1-112]|uniref:DUF397 domain-containing protein n=1 Tax=Streptomonospora mangrovi TaxID=2883123 RepID=A0A9X3NNN7_9ACTN|nr:DUF397 domain-containing protein [Streptomonospora mangrovi]MDA0566762.1 DUF397 domain-containing protein [Streptomonospora mangrovi]
MDTQWRKSSYSGPRGDCLEARIANDGAALVRDTQNREGGMLAFPVTEWSAFLAEVDRL